jgi:hypothetical protein
MDIKPIFIVNLSGELLSKPKEWIIQYGIDLVR